MKKLYFSRIVAFVLCYFTMYGSMYSQPFDAQGANVTVIIHGWNPDGSQPDWMQSMADAIIARNGGNGNVGTITVTGTQGNLTATCTNWTFDLANQTHAEIVVIVNWTAVSNHLNTGITAQEVAAVVAPKIYNSQNSEPALSELPVHLIGHSRGGGMVFELARLLGLQGVDIDHLTALDPHPLTSADPQPFLGDVIDTPVEIYENVIFADVYYQNIEFPKGEYVSGAYNRLWTSLPGGYHNETGYTYNILGTNYNFSDHLNIILAYHGTTDLTTPVSNGEATMTQTERDNWFNTYENGGENTGFKYSHQLAGDRTSSNIPVSSGDQINDGYHSLLGGNGLRQGLTWTNAQWPNIIEIAISKNSSSLTVGTHNLTNGDQLDINTIYRTCNASATISFYADIDRNPYNNNKTLLGAQSVTATGNSFVTSNLIWTSSGLNVGNKYYIYVEINDNAKKRFFYAPYEFDYVSLNLPEITTQPQDQTNICPGSNVDFLIAGTNIDNYTWEVNEGNGFSALSNNSIYSGVATATLSITDVTLSMNNYHYRCVVSNTDGNVTSDTATLTTDSESPVITSTHNGQQIDANANCEAALPDYTGDVTATDNCDANLDVTQSPLAGTTISGITNTVTLTVTDDAGNYAETTFNVEVADNTNPVIISTHNSQQIDANANCEAALPDYTGDVTATDNCDANLDVTQSPLAGTTISGITNTVTLTVTDDAGNYAETTFNVEVVDNTNPVIISTHNSQQIDANANCEAALPDYTGDVTATDNCDANLDVTQSPLAGTTISGITNTVTLTVTDDAGNYAETTFNVEVVDNTDPNITCPDDQTINLNEGETFYTVQGTEFDPIETIDNCGVADASNDYNASSTLENEELTAGTYTISWTVTDNAGNENACIFEVVVNGFVGISELATGIEVYPNPTSGVFVIAGEAKQSVKSVEITDISGKIIKQISNPENQNYEVDLSTQATGIYLLKIQTDEGIVFEKIIKQ